MKGKRRIKEERKEILRSLGARKEKESILTKSPMRWSTSSKHLREKKRARKKNISEKQYGEKKKKENTLCTWASLQSGA